MYDENVKARNVKSLKKNFEQVRLTVKRGTLAKYKSFAERRGMSMTAYITSLVDAEIAQDVDFCAEWAAKAEAERAEAEREKAETVAAIRSGIKPPESSAPVKPLPRPKPEK